MHHDVIRLIKVAVGVFDDSVEEDDAWEGNGPPLQALVEPVWHMPNVIGGVLGQFVSGVGRVGDFTLL